MSEHDLIEEYLDRLVEVLGGPGAEVRRALFESEDHLREAQAALIREGSSPEEAARAAIERFGEPEEVATRYELERLTASPGQLLGQTLLALMLVGSITLIAIGLSGGVAAIGGAIFGQEFISGDAPGVTYTAERCQEYLALEPDAGSCEAAAVIDHYYEVITSRIAAGVLGLVMLAVWWAARAGSRRPGMADALPGGFVYIACTALFAGAAMVTGVLGVQLWVFGGTETGPGYFVSAAVVSVIAAIGFGIKLVQSLRTAGG